MEATAFCGIPFRNAASIPPSFSTSWVDDVRESALFLQHHLRVAGDAKAEIIGLANHLVKRTDLHAVTASQHAGECFDRGTDQIVVWIHGRLVPARRADMQRSLPCGLVSSCHRHSPRPEHAEGPQLCDFHEEVLSNRDGKPNPRCGKVYFQSRLGQLAEILHTCCQRVCQLLQGVAAGLMPRPTVNTNGLQMRRFGHSPAGESRHLAVSGIQRLRQFAFVGEDAQRVHLNAAGQLLR